jgi:hypothetical protein
MIEYTNNVALLMRKYASPIILQCLQRIRFLIFLVIDLDGS